MKHYFIHFGPCLTVIAASLTFTAGAASDPIDESGLEGAHLLKSANRGQTQQDDGYEVVQSASGLEAINPKLSIRTKFEDQGFVCRPESRTTNNPSWTWGLALESYGFEGSQVPVSGASCIRSDGGEVTYAWNSNLEEWLINDQRGLEHGFTLQQRPGNLNMPDAHLTFHMHVQGNLLGQLNQDARGVRFLDANGTTVLQYSGLHVFDADKQAQTAFFEIEDDRLSIVIDERGALYPLTIDPIVQSAYLKPINPNSSNNYGDAVATWQDLVVVGAPNEKSDSGGVNGDPFSTSMFHHGAAYIYRKTAGVWSHEAYLKHPTPGTFPYVRRFGQAVAIGEGRVIVCALGSTSLSPQGGGAFIFENVLGQWIQTAHLPKGSSKSVGSMPVATSGDRIVLGGRNSNVDVFNVAAGFWTLEQSIPTPNFDSEFGAAIDIDGDTLVVGAYRDDSIAPISGAAYVYEFTNGSWAQTDYLKASNPGQGDHFGYSVAVVDGRIAVGAPLEDSVTQGINGNDGDDLRPYSGGVYIFEKVGTSWAQQSLLKAKNAGQIDLFGWKLASEGNRLAVGSKFESSSATGVNGAGHLNDLVGAGAAYTFLHDGAGWVQEAYLKAHNPGPNDDFGSGLGLSSDRLIVGANSEDGGSNTINGDGSDNSIWQSGAAYIFELDAPIGNFCGTAALNSSGLPGKIAGAGSFEVVQNAFSLHVSDLPTGVFGYIISSQGQALVPMSGGSQGTRCLGNGFPIGRHFDSLSNSGGSGVIDYTVDLTNIPGPTGPGTIIAGETWNFQCWFRDSNPMPTSNFTNGVSAQFQ